MRRIKDTLNSKCIQEWHSSIENLNKGNNYSILKSTSAFEDNLTFKYITKICKKCFCKIPNNKSEFVD